jgi:hypothetical protein
MKYIRKTCLLSVLVLTAFLGSQSLKAASAPIEELNAGLNDAWVSAEAPLQGMFVTVFPSLKLVFLAWFTFDSIATDGTSATFGASDQRWVTAVGSFSGATATLNAELTTGGSFNSSVPAPTQDTNYGTITLNFTSCEEATVSFDFPGPGQAGELTINRVLPDGVALCEALDAPDPEACVRPEADMSHGPNNPPIVNNAIIPTSEVFDGGPGPDGIPPIESPIFTQDLSSAGFGDFELVAGVKIDDEIRAYPHNILNWHEVINDQFIFNGISERATVSYCPLTGSAMLWKAFIEPANKTFGTSGLLYNSNLIMYDRGTTSFWSQMLEQSVAGPEIQRIPDRLQLIETSWGTWKAMYPGTKLLTENTGFSRDYDAYPYDTFREDNNLLWPTNNSDDNRLHKKERVLGINVGNSSKVYPISNFAGNIEVINEKVGDMEVVVTGSAGFNFGAVYNRELEDCTMLTFEAVPNKLPVVMKDNEGNEWDVFGIAVTGARTGEQLQKTNSYIAYWYAWTAFFPGADIHQ